MRVKNKHLKFFIIALPVVAIVFVILFTLWLLAPLFSEKYCIENETRYLRPEEKLEDMYTPTERERKFVGEEDPSYKVSGFTRTLVRCTDSWTYFKNIGL